MFLRYNLLAFSWALFILIVCAIPGNHIPQLRFIDWLKPDKIVHLILFGVLSFLLIRAFQQQTSFPFLYKHARLYAILFSSIYGVVIELLQQYFFIKRSGEIFDAVADAVGALLGMLFFNYLMKKKLAKKIF
jgi:VanZ family protein